MRQVNEELSGQPVNEVMTALQKRFLAGGVKPDIKGLLLYAKKNFSWDAGRVAIRETPSTVSTD